VRRVLNIGSKNSEKLCMSMLARYKKPGGFLQLISLMESFGPQKREKFLEMIDLEAPAWGKAIREKFLSMERLLSWPDQVVSEVFKNLPVKNLACAIKGLQPANAEKITKFLSHADRRKLEDELTNLKAKPEEIATTFVKVIEMARQMIKKGEIRLDKVDPGLIVGESMELSLESGDLSGAAEGHEESEDHGDGLSSSSGPAVHNGHSPAYMPKAAASEKGIHGITPTEVVAMQTALATSTRENKALRDEVKHLREKLDQIRRIA
jgi:hypothetical protein